MFLVLLYECWCSVFPIRPVTGERYITLYPTIVSESCAGLGLLYACIRTLSYACIRFAAKLPRSCYRFAPGRSARLRQPASPAISCVRGVTFPAPDGLDRVREAACDTVKAHSAFSPDSLEPTSREWRAAKTSAERALPPRPARCPRPSPRPVWCHTGHPVAAACF